MPKTKIGENLYLFTHAANVFKDDLVISAHGGWNQSCGQFNTKERLHFYVDHGDVQSDFGIYRFRHAPEVKQTILKGFTSYNYSLSKYQGYHGGAKGKPAETYESIDMTIAAIQVEIDKFQTYMKNPDYAKINANKVQPTQFDVLTIRNRIGAGDQKLETVLDAVRGLHAYTRVHCFFCRSFF